MPKYAVDKTETSTGAAIVAAVIDTELDEQEALKMVDEVHEAFRATGARTLMVDLTETNAPMFSREARYTVKRRGDSLQVSRVLVLGPTIGSQKMHAMIAVRLMVDKNAKIKFFSESDGAKGLDWLEEAALEPETPFEKEKEARRQRRAKAEESDE